jgi:hypothetical protein
MPDQADAAPQPIVRHKIRTRPGKVVTATMKPAAVIAALEQLHIP